MTEQTNEQTTRTVKHRDEKMSDLLADIAALQEKINKKQAQHDALKMEADNEEAVAALQPGDNVSYAFGRAATRRIRSGVIRAVNTNDKGVTQLKVETGEGFDSEFNIIDASAVLLTPEQVEAEQARIDAAAAAAPAEAEGGAE